MTIKVLLVDDQRLTGIVLQRLLATEADIEIHCCQVAADALQKAAEIRPHVILQDLVMPDVEGFSMLHRYRANAVTARTPVVILSADEHAETRARAFCEGASDFIVKMPAKTDLLACIRRHGDAVSDLARPCATPLVS